MVTARAPASDAIYNTWIDEHQRGMPAGTEIIFVLEGQGEQMVDDRPPVKVGPGASIYIPADVFHSTLNTGSQPLRLAIVYAPAGPERLLREITGCRVVPPGS